MLFKGKAVNGTPFTNINKGIPIKQGSYYIVQDNFNKITNGGNY